MKLVGLGGGVGVMVASDGRRLQRVGESQALSHCVLWRASDRDVLEFRVIVECVPFLNHALQLPTN